MKFTTRFLFVCFVSLLAAGFFAGPASAQVLYGSIVGTVLDQSNATVPSATVTIVNSSTGLSREANTDAAGRYLFPNVLPGSYDLTITATGFRPFKQSGVDVTLGAVTRVEAKLELGGVTEQLTIAATVTALQTDKSDVRSEISTRAITTLPLSNYRNYQTLLNLVPGASPAGFQNAVVDSPARALTTNVNGTNRNSNNTRLDGATNVFLWLPHHTVYVAPVESIETVNISTASFDAEQGMAGGAAITVATKSGTNDLHGVAFWYHDNQHLKARNYFLKTPQKPKNINNTTGGTLGGPIIRNKLFYFGSFEAFLERSGQAGIWSMPTANVKRGDFSAEPVVIYDPATGTPSGAGRTPFSGNMIPLTRQSAISRRIQEGAPEPNLSGSLNNFFNSGTEAMNRYNSDAKVNYTPATKLAVFAKYSRMDALVNSGFAFGAVGGTGLSRAGVGDGDTMVNIGTTGFTWTFSPTMLLDGTFGYTRFDQSVTGPDYGRNIGSDVWGIPGTNGADIRQSGMPILDFEGYSDWGNIYGWLPLFRNDRSYTYTTNFSKISGAHEFRMGFDLVRHHMDHWQPEISNGPRGYIQFTGGTTAVSGGASPNYLNSYASFLLSQPYQFQKAVQFLLMTNREWQFGWYFRDRWQFNRKLTLNLGLRYEYYPLITRADRGIERWDPTTNQVFMGGVGNNPNNVGITTSKKLFAPRIGFAYRFDDNTVIRSGYGITYDPLPFARPLRGLYPATIAATWVGDTSFSAVRTLEQGIPAVPTPDISSGVLALPPSVDMGPRSPWAGELHRGYIQSWNFTVERKLPGDLVGTVAYVGNSTVHQLADLDINAAAPGTGAAGRPLSATQGRRITANMWDGWLSANYHSFQASLNRQFAKGLFLKGAYTWSKAISMTDDDGWASVTWNWAPVIGRNRAVAGYDRTHAFSMGYAYELPFGPGKTWAESGPVSWLLRGWQTNGVFSAYTGIPFNVTASSASLNAPGNGQMADLVISGKPTKLGGIGSGDPFYDPAAFRQVTDVRFGTLGRNVLRGPGMINLDLSLFRTFALTERFKMEFKAESFNFSNTPKFANPAANASNMRVNPDGSIQSLGDFMQITSTITSSYGGAVSVDRQFRFGLRLSF